ncbi:MAG: hypothetical protein R2873_15540 [Caldilineaceae bacterium]
MTKPQDNFTDITLHDNAVISTAESRSLQQIGIDGEILHTPGHSGRQRRSCSTMAPSSPVI